MIIGTFKYALVSFIFKVKDNSRTWYGDTARHRRCVCVYVLLCEISSEVNVRQCPLCTTPERSLNSNPEMICPHTHTGAAGSKSSNHSHYIHDSRWHDMTCTVLLLLLLPPVSTYWSYLQWELFLFCTGVRYLVLTHKGFLLRKTHALINNAWTRI